MSRPITQLFMLQSVDGKISTGSTDEFDVDKDFPVIPSTKDGLHQYYEIEQRTDLWSLGTGRTMAKIGINEREMPKEPTVNFVMIDNNHLTTHALEWFCTASPKKFVLVTTNPDHVAFQLDAFKYPNMSIIFQPILDLTAMMETLHYLGCQYLTCQCGSTINAMLLKEHLINRVHLVIAPIIIGGNDVPSLVGGEGLKNHEDITELNGLQLVEMNCLKNSYIELVYDVM